MCHRTGDKPAPSQETLLKKYKNADDSIKAAKASKNPMMKAIQGYDDLLKKAVSDLGLKWFAGANVDSGIFTPNLWPLTLKGVCLTISSVLCYFELIFLKEKNGGRKKYKED